MKASPIVLLWLLAANMAGAATITVTSTADNGAGTLRQALANAVDGDTIDATGVSGTILLTSGELLVTNSVTILGPGPNYLAVDGNAASRVFNIPFSNEVTIASLTISNGAMDIGGGIYDTGSALTVSNCVLRGNLAVGSAGALYALGGAVNIVNCTLAGNTLTYGGYGGAIYGSGCTLTIFNSTISGNSNSNGYGGAIYIDGGGTYEGVTVTITGCTISSNYAGVCGGVENSGDFGPVVMIIDHSTLSGNSALSVGAIYNSVFFGGLANLSIFNSTLSGNSAQDIGGIAFDGPDFSGEVDMGNTILNAGASGVNTASSVGINSLGFNLSSDDTGACCGPGDQLNTDPMLGPLQDNGGPTFTHALLPASPAIDRGKNFNGSATDQRGFPRPVDFPTIPNASGGDGSDIGAFEVQSLTFGATLTVNTTMDNTLADDFLTLREAILLVNYGGDPAFFRLLTAGERKQISGRFGGNDKIQFDPSVFGTIRLTGGELAVWSDVAIVGPGPATLAVDGNAASRVFHNHGNTVICNLTVTNGFAADIPYSLVGGGGFLNDHGILTVSNCVIVGNSSDVGGGFDNYGSDYYHASATLAVINCTVSGNSATGGGGGIYNDGFDYGSANLTIVNSTLNGNSADFGGGIENQGELGSATLSITNSTLSGNSASYNGGGIITDGSQSGHAILQIVNSTLSGNSTPSPFTAGGIDLNDLPSSSNTTVEIGSTILNAGASGSNISSDSGTVISLGYNLSSDNGGGYLNQPTDLTNTDPMLGPLLDNGGSMFTHALLCGSPAIDHGFNFSGATNDQRGVDFTRTFDDPLVPNASGGDGTDIGAYEVQPGGCAPLDSDGDGVPDAIDQCPDTPAGAIIDATGCSISQLVPCDGPLSGGTWKNHGQYVRSVVRTANAFLKASLITRKQWAQIVTGAAHSKCGWNRHSDHDGDRDWHRDWDCSHDANWNRDSSRDKAS